MEIDIHTDVLNRLALERATLSESIKVSVLGAVGLGKECLADNTQYQPETLDTT